MVLGTSGLFGSPAPGKPPSAGPAQPSLSFTVRLFDYAEVSSATLAEAQIEATLIFERLGVAVAWLDCRPLAVRTPPPAACKETLRTTDFVLRILSGSESARALFGKDTLGYVVLDGGRGSMASIFYDHVEELAREGGLSQSQVLGHAIAHEIGHLLLGSGAHSRHGIMSAKWNQESLHQDAMWSLRFSPEQAAGIRAEVQALHGQKAPADHSSLSSPR